MKSQALAAVILLGLAGCATAQPPPPVQAQGNVGPYATIEGLDGLKVRTENEVKIEGLVGLSTLPQGEPSKYIPFITIEGLNGLRVKDSYDK